MGEIILRLRYRVLQEFQVDVCGQPVRTTHPTVVSFDYVVLKRYVGVRAALGLASALLGAGEAWYRVGRGNSDCKCGWSDGEETVESGLRLNGISDSCTLGLTGWSRN